MSRGGRRHISDALRRVLSSFWIENIPQDISCDTRDVLVQYINSVIKTDNPDESDVELYQLVKRLQTHSHSKYFKKTPPSSGRFKFYFVSQTI